MFGSSVRRFPCGLAVNVLANAQQPYVFWKEMLKELMHSMSMSMIREKAVRNFMKRINVSRGAVTVGWLELRKGFNTYLMDCGDLVVFRDGVLEDHPSSPSDAEEMKLDSFPADFSGRIGKWNVSCSIVAENNNCTIDGSDENSLRWNEGLDIATNNRILESPRDLLPGAFEYHLVLSSGDACLQLLNHVASRKYKPPPALRNIDTKLRGGIPLLVPPPALSGATNDHRPAAPGGDGSELTTSAKIVRLSYQFFP